MAREIAKRELAMENKKKRRYVQQEQPQVRKPLEKVYFQEGEESESSDEEITKVKCKKSKKNTKEASSSSESSSIQNSKSSQNTRTRKKIKCQNTYKKKIKVTKICKVLTFIFFKNVNSLKVSVGGGAMVHGNTLSSNKGTPADKSLFTETGNTLNYPRGYHDACKTRKKPW